MVTNIDHLNLSVHNFDQSVDWYKRIFGFHLVQSGQYQGNPWGILRSKDAMLCIYEHPERAFADGEALQEHKLHGFNHFALKIIDRQAWEETVKRERLSINYGGPVEWPRSTSWYINDPTGYEIEVALWREGKPDFSHASIS